MNSTINTQLNHRTIRKFTGEKINESTLKTLYEVANRTGTSMGMQTYSIIRITDSEIKERLAVIGKQDYMKDATELFVFIVDQFRNAEIARAQGVEESLLNDMDKFFQGFTDASLACQNMIVAAESLGLGCNYYGNIHNDTQAVIDLLKLPKLTYPVLGLGIGYPNQEPALKPRMEMDIKVFDNSYKIYDDYLDLLKDYDQVMQTYYDLRDTKKALDKFTLQVKGASENFIEKRKEIMKAIVYQGFDLML
ncbi:MAG: NADPH-dependent oxidoreductase [Tissierellia bacterium]|nr:NADPH-dependent oxidoreductase [Tissierellia bacterium]